MLTHICIINGVNLNLLGKREPHLYGAEGFESYFERLQKKYPQLSFSHFQSNVEGELVNELHHQGFKSHMGIILNAGAYTHTSIALHDALLSITAPVIEVHISNVFARETYRHHSYISPVAKGIIVGLGLKGYQLAVEGLLDY